MQGNTNFQGMKYYFSGNFKIVIILFPGKRFSMVPPVNFQEAVIHLK